MNSKIINETIYYQNDKFEKLQSHVLIIQYIETLL